MEVFDRTNIDVYDLNNDSEVQKTQSDAERLLNLSKDEETIAYCCFLADFLEEFNKFNAFFQNRDTLLNHLVFPKVCSFLHTVCFLFMKREIVMQVPADKIDLSQSCLPSGDIHIGNRCTQYLKELPDRQKAALVEAAAREHIFKYYKKVFTDFLRRFIKDNKNLKLWRFMQFVNPEFALSSQKLLLLPPYTCLRDNYQIYSDFDYALLEMEWTDLLHCFGEEEKESLKKLEVVKFWSKIFKIKSAGTERLRFPTRKRLVLIFFSLPHSNAEPERQFSDVNKKKRPKKYHDR